MAMFKPAVLTEAGIALSAKVHAGLTTMSFTKAATGDGICGEGELPASLSGLKNQRQEFQIDRVKVVNNHTVSLRFVVFNNQGDQSLTEGYYVKEVGIFADDPDAGEILYAVAEAVPDQWDYLPAYNGLQASEIVMEFYTEVSNTENVTIVTKNGPYAYQEDLEDVRTIVEVIRQQGSGSNMISAAFSENTAYSVGSYARYENVLYRFTGNKEAGAWDPDIVQEVTVAEELVQQRGTTQKIIDSMGKQDAYDPEHLYMAGDFCIQNNQMYKRNEDMAEDTELPHPWDETEWTATSIAEEIRQLNVNMASKSHVGMIIHSTTMDTMEKVIAVYGGTEWQKIEGRFLLGASSSYKNDSTGGEATHKLTVQEMPSHTHSLPEFAVATDNSKSITQYNTTTGVCNSTGFISRTSAAGNGTPHNNMPPYRAVYIWERTA